MVVDYPHWMQGMGHFEFRSPPTRRISSEGMLSGAGLRRRTRSRLIATARISLRNEIVARPSRSWLAIAEWRGRPVPIGSRSIGVSLQPAIP
jgi:hypothetical protein